MDQQFCINIASEMGLALPHRYLNLIANYPHSLLDLADVFPGPKGQPEHRIGPETGELYNDHTLVRVANLGDVEYRLSIFPGRFFIIGDSGCGDYYAIDTTIASAPVFESGPHAREKHEDGLPEKVADSIEDWVKVVGNINQRSK